jgi:hypothetical protein
MTRRDELLRQAAERGKDAPLYRHLPKRQGSEWRASFSEIEGVLGFDLPDSARVHRPWWANQGDKDGHSHSLSWAMAGWKKSQVDMSRNRSCSSRRKISYCYKFRAITPPGGLGAPGSIPTRPCVEIGQNKKRQFDCRLRNISTFQASGIAVGTFPHSMSDRCAK